MSEPLKSLKWYKELADGSERRKAGVFLVEGERAIRQVSLQKPESIREILATSEPAADLGLYPVRKLTESQFNSISQAVTPQGILAVVSLPDECYADTPPSIPGNRILLLEDIQDPGNVGTLLRTAAAFDYTGVILSGKSADPFSPKCVPAAAGTLLSLWLRRTDGYLALAASLRKQGYRLAAAALDGTENVSVVKHEKLVLALGNEAAGISGNLRKLADHVFRLPVNREKAESLNVAICGGICLYLSTR